MSSKNTKIYDLIIIGAGPVGLFGADLSGYYGMNTLVIESTHYYGGKPAKLYANKPIHDFPTYTSINGQELIDKLYECVEVHKDKIDFIYDTLIEKHYVDKENIIHLVDNLDNEYLAKKVLLTVGTGCFEFIKPDIEGINENKNIHYSLNNIGDNHENKKIIILGGGDSAIDLSLHLSKKNFVTLIHRRNELRAKGEAIDKLKSTNTNIFLNYNINSIDKNFVYINENEKFKIEKIEYDFILVQYGLAPIAMPHHSWENFEMENKKYVVDRHFKTNVDGFYAAGSCSTYDKRFDLIITGIGEASIAINHIYASLFPNKKGW